MKYRCRSYTGCILHFRALLLICWGTRWRSWLRPCATSRKFAGSIPDGVIGIFHLHNSSGRTVTLGLTKPLTEDYILGVEAAGA